jgi:cytochrome c oxidase subunit II
MVNRAFSNMVSLLTAEGAQAAPKVPESPFFWMPNQASTLSGSIDNLFNLLVWVSVISSAGILAAMVYFCAKYRAKSRSDRAQSQVDHNTTLEITWSVAPLVILVAVFVWGFKDYVNLRTSPKEAYEIHAQGQKWNWTFTYPNGYVDGTLHVPVEKNVRILISSADVLHSLFIPEFRVKMDAVPGRYTSLWFNATKPGTFPIYCTEYCGTSHSDMLSQIVVHDQKGFDTWLGEAVKKMDDMPPVELGKKIFSQRGCATCHSTDGSPKIGPTFKGLWGKSESIVGGSSVQVDENYIRESLFEPQAKIVQGFAPAMPTFKGQLSDKQVTGLIEYIKTLK